MATDERPRAATPQHAFDTLGLREGETVVDVGCGAGGFVRWLGSHGVTAVGIECGAEMLARAAEGSAIDVREGVGQDLPVATGSADAVTFLSSLHHIPAGDMTAALAEARRVIGPGGRVYVSEPLAEGPGFEVGRLVDDETVVRAEAQDALAACDEAGLEVVATGDFLDRAVYADFETFARLMTDIDPDRAERFHSVRTEVEAAFHRHGRVASDGVAFDHPKRFHLLAPR